MTEHKKHWKCPISLEWVASNVPVAEAEDAISYDSSGRVLKNDGSDSKNNFHGPAPVWPPPGLNIVCDIPGHSLRDQWPRGDKAQKMNRGGGTNVQQASPTGDQK